MSTASEHLSWSFTFPEKVTQYKRPSSLDSVKKWGFTQATPKSFFVFLFCLGSRYNGSSYCMPSNLNENRRFKKYTYGFSLNQTKPKNSFWWSKPNHKNKELFFFKQTQMVCFWGHAHTPCPPSFSYFALKTYKQTNKYYTLFLDKSIQKKWEIMRSSLLFLLYINLSLAWKAVFTVLGKEQGLSDAPAKIRLWIMSFFDKQLLQIQMALAYQICQRCLQQRTGFYNTQYTFSTRHVKSHIFHNFHNWW